MRRRFGKIILVAEVCITIAALAITKIFVGDGAATYLAIGFWAFYYGTFLWLRRRSRRFDKPS